MFYFVSYIIDFCHYSILFSNLVIAVQRAFVFFLRNLTDRFFESLVEKKLILTLSFSNYRKVIYIWISSIYIFAFGVEYALMFSNCQYRFGELARKYQLICETTNYANVVITMTTPTEVQLVIIKKK